MTKKILNQIRRARNLYNRYITYYKYKEVLGKNLTLKNKFKGKRCFIIGSGPSIKDQDLLKLAGEETFVCNTFWRHPQYYKINPKNYAGLDPGPPQLKSNFFKEELAKKEKDLTSLPTRFFFHLDGFCDYFKSVNAFQRNNVYYLHMGGFLKENLNFNIEIDKTIPHVKNVIIGCITIAVYMGFEEIYLLGCEHGFLASPRQFEEEHFFPGTAYTTSVNEKEREHYAMTIKSYEEQIDQVKILFKNYRLLKAKLAKEKPQVKIYNATPNSFLDVFPFVKFEDIKF